MCAGCWAQAGARASSRWPSGLACPATTRCTISSAAEPGMMRHWMMRHCGTRWLRRSTGRSAARARCWWSMTRVFPRRVNSRSGWRGSSGALGKVANCQVLVSLTLACGEVPLPVGLRLFLPSAWTDDAERCDAAGVPEAARTAQSKPEIALAEIDRVRAAGVRFSCVLADAGFGSSPAFRQGLEERELAWAAGIAGTQLVYPTTVKLHPTYTPSGRPAKHPVPNRPLLSAAEMLDKQRWRRITWRTGTKGPLNARFAAVRVRVADGPLNAADTRLPGEELWLIGEWRDSGEKKYYLSNLPQRTALRRLVTTVKARWSCEQVHQQLKQELGLGDFEGRSWTGLHRHALMTCIAFAYLQHRRLKAAGRGKKGGAQRTTTAAIAA